MNLKAKVLFSLLNFMIRVGWLSVLNDACCFKNGIAQVKDEKAQHEGNRIAAVNQGISDHDGCVEKKFDNNG